MKATLIFIIFALSCIIMFGQKNHDAPAIKAHHNDVTQDSVSVLLQEINLIIDCCEKIRKYAAIYKTNNSLAQKLYLAAIKEGLSPDLVFSLAKVESNFNPRSVSNKGAIGLLQIMPSTAMCYGVTKKELFDVDKNIKTGVKHLKVCIKKRHGDLVAALQEYNQGNVIEQPYNYANKVLQTASSSYIIRR